MKKKSKLFVRKITDDEPIKKFRVFELPDVEPTAGKLIKKLLSELFICICRIVVVNNYRNAERRYHLALQKEFYMGIELLAKQQGGIK